MASKNDQILAAAMKATGKTDQELEQAWWTSRSTDRKEGRTPVNFWAYCERVAKPS